MSVAHWVMFVVQTFNYTDNGSSTMWERKERSHYYILDKYIVLWLKYFFYYGNMNHRMTRCLCFIVTYPYMNTWNRHRMFITHIGIPKHKNIYDFLVQVRNVLLPLSLKVFRHKESDTLFHLPTPTTTRDTHRKASASSESQPSSSDAKTQLTDFSQILQILRARFRCMTSFTPPDPISYLGFLFWHLWMTHPPHACVNTCAHVSPN